MRNALSTAVIALALALLVPSNGAEAVRLLPLGTDAQAVNASLTLDMPAEKPVATAALSSLGSPDSGMAWVMALGFLGFVILRRIR